MDDPTSGETPPADETPAASTAAAPAPTPSEDDHATIHCDQCSEVVPNLTYCVRCGDPLGPEQRRGREGRVRDMYAASTGEKANRLTLVSTIYPSLPREEIRTFQLALAGGTALVVLLGLLGLFPVAIVAAAILVPLVTVIYLYDVDVYEDEPIRVIALTFVWGAVTGALFSFAIAQLFPVTAASLIGGPALGGGDAAATFPWVRAVIAPLVSVVVIIAGPLALLPYRRFNDALDGATFGVAAGVAFVGAQTLITAIDLFQSGLQPVGQVLPWVVRLLVLGVGMPVIAAGVIGGLGGALWLRYRAPVHDRARLGPVGQPIIAFVLAVAAFVIAAVGEHLLPEVGSLILVALLAVVSLLWLRRVIHLGLLQEASEIEIGPDIACPECHVATPFHTYCAHCGASLKALPKSRHAIPAAVAAGDLHAHHRAQPTLPADLDVPAGGAAAAVGGSAFAAVPRQHGWLGPRALLAIFALVMLAAVSLAAAFAAANGRERDQPPCETPDQRDWDSPGTLPCAGAITFQDLRALLATPTNEIPTGHPFADRLRYTDPTIGFGLQYDPGLWSIAQEGEGFLVLSALNNNVALIVEAGSTSRVADAKALFDIRKELMGRSLLGYTEDTAPARALLGNPLVGYQVGVGGLFGGAMDTPQGPSLDFTVASVAASNGDLVVAITLLTPVELTIQRGDQQIAVPVREFGLTAADSIVNSFTWPGEEIPQ
ncbi:MAG: hypothetical protein KF809_08205 [Chloroflexi bacterium]|nr:hypothetical protein [Chloroflexota bacterium]